MQDRRTRNVRALALIGLVSMASTVSTSAAHAAPHVTSAPSAEKTRAADLFKKGSEAYMKGDFAAAIVSLEEAHKLDPQPVLIYNQARAHEGLGHTDVAIKLYEQYVSEEPTSPDRGAIEQRLATLKKQRDDKATAERERQALEEERARASRPPPPKKHSVLPYVVGGVGVAGLATGAVFGLMAGSKESDGETAPSQRAAIDARDTGATFATVANVSFIAGGVLLAVGAVWWALDHGGSSKRTGVAAPPRLELGFGAIGGTF